MLSIKKLYTLLFLVSCFVFFNQTQSRSLREHRYTAYNIEKLQNMLDFKTDREEYHTGKHTYLKKLWQARKLDKKEFLENTKTLVDQGLKNQTEPYTFIANFDSRHYYGANLELLNASNQSDCYSFIQYMFDTGIYVHPYLQELEQETLEFKAIARMKGIAGDAGRYLQTQPARTKIGWAVTEYTTSTNFNRFSLWMRELWLKYYFDKDKKGFTQTGIFPYSLGHGIALGNADPTLVGEPFPGQYTFEQIDQFRPGMLISNTFNKDQASWDIYFGFGKNYSTSFNHTAELSEAQNTARSSNVSRGYTKHNYIIAAQVKAFAQTKDPNTTCLLNPYIVFNYDNTQKVEFECDANNRLYTFGGCFEWKNGPVSVSIEGAQNLGHQKVKAWDRNELNFSAITWNSHLLFINPDLVAVASYPASTAAATDEDQFTHAIGIPVSPTSESILTPNAVPDATYSRQFANGEAFEIYPATGLTPSPLIYKNSNSRFRNAYTNKYQGWFIMGDLGFQFIHWRLGTSLGIISGDESPNDTTNYILATRRYANDSSGNAFTYKDTNKTYKGFVGIHEMFQTKSITPCFIHEAQKLNNYVTESNNLTTPQLTNLLFVGCGLKHHSVYNHKERLADFNIIAYAQKKETLKGTNMPYTEFIDLEYSAARQTDAIKKLDTFLGIECNAGMHYKATHDLDIFGKMAVFVPGKYYSTAEGKYIPFNKQADLVVANNSGIFTEPEQFNITLGKDTAFFVTAGLTYNFDSLLLKNKQKMYKSHRKKNV